MKIRKAGDYQYFEYFDYYDAVARKLDMKNT